MNDFAWMVVEFALAFGVFAFAFGILFILLVLLLNNGIIRARLYFYKFFRDIH